MKKCLFLLAFLIFALFDVRQCCADVVTNSSEIVIRYYDDNWELHEIAINPWTFNILNYMDQSLNQDEDTCASLYTYLMGLLKCIGLDYWLMPNGTQKFSFDVFNIYDLNYDWESSSGQIRPTESYLTDFFRSKFSSGLSEFITIFENNYFEGVSDYVGGAAYLTLFNTLNLNSIATNVEAIARSMTTGGSGGGAASSPAAPAGYYPMIYTNAVLAFDEDNLQYYTNGYMVVTNYIQNGLFLSSDEEAKILNELLPLIDSGYGAGVLDFYRPESFYNASVPSLLFRSLNQQCIITELLYGQVTRSYKFFQDTKQSLISLTNGINQLVNNNYSVSNYFGGLQSDISYIGGSVSNINSQLAFQYALLNNTDNFVEDIRRHLIYLESGLFLRFEPVISNLQTIANSLTSTNSLQYQLIASLQYNITNELAIAASNIVMNIQSNNMVECCSNMFYLVGEVTNVIDRIADFLDRQNIEDDTGTNSFNISSIEFGSDWGLPDIVWKEAAGGDLYGWDVDFSTNQIWKSSHSWERINSTSNGFAQLLKYLDLVQSRQLATIGNLSYMILQELQDGEHSLTNIDVSDMESELRDRLDDLQNVHRYDLENSLQNSASIFLGGLDNLGRLQSSIEGYKAFIDSFGDGALRNFTISCPRFFSNENSPSSNSYDILVVIEDWAEAVSYLRLFMMCIWGFLLFKVCWRIVVAILSFSEWLFFTMLLWAIPREAAPATASNYNGLFSRFMLLLDTVWAAPAD